MDTTVKVVSIHVAAAIICSFLSAVLSLGWLGFKNEVFAFIIGLVVLYAVGQLCQQLFGEEIEGFQAWLWDGILPFGFCWFIAWTMLVNYL